MFRINYKVTGEDVDDFMVMQNDAYYAYSISAIKNFLHKKGIPSKQLMELDQQLIDREQLDFFKDLMFTQQFFINLDAIELDKDKLNVRNRFFNANNELCASLSLELGYPKILAI